VERLGGVSFWRISRHSPWDTETRQACAYNVIFEAGWRNLFCCGKAISIKHSALVIRHEPRMRRTIFSPVACLPLPYFSTLSHKRHDFQNSATEHKISLICDNNVTTQNLWFVFSGELFKCFEVLQFSMSAKTALQRPVLQTALWHYNC